MQESKSKKQIERISSKVIEYNLFSFIDAFILII